MLKSNSCCPSQTTLQCQPHILLHFYIHITLYCLCSGYKSSNAVLIDSLMYTISAVWSIWIFFFFHWITDQKEMEWHHLQLQWSLIEMVSLINQHERPSGKHYYCSRWCVRQVWGKVGAPNNHPTSSQSNLEYVWHHKFSAGISKHLMRHCDLISHKYARIMFYYQK